MTSPVVYENVQLAHLLEEQGATALVHPNLLPYFPCAEQPRLAEGVVDVPRYMVWFDHPYQPHPYEPSSPFLGIRDLFSVQRLPLTDGSNPPPGVVVYEVERPASGTIEAPPEQATVRSS